MIRVLVKASSTTTRAALERLLRANPRFEVIDRSSTAGLRDGSIEAFGPDVVVAQVAGQDDELAQELLDWAAAGGPVVVLVDDPAAAWTGDALRAGVKAVLPSGLAGEEISAAVEAAVRGLVVLHPEDVENLLSAGARTADGVPAALVESLTPREIQVLRLLAEGLGNKGIASRLEISEHTVKFHVASILGKLGAASRTEAVTLGIRNGLIMI